MMQSNRSGPRRSGAIWSLSVVTHLSVALLVSIACAFVSPPSEPRTTKGGQAVPSTLFASDKSMFFADTPTSERLDDDPTDGGCGEGFLASEDGDLCVFDYDAAALAFGTAPEEEMVDDAEHYWEELENENASRKKFGLKSLTPEQFVVLQAQIHQLGADQREKMSRQREESAAATKKKEREDALPNLLKGFMDAAFRDTCESNYDCERPEVCCDFNFRKMCCSSGETSRNLQHEYAMVPVPQQSYDYDY